ncbi:hypothetical protein, partial [Dialister succinatiphilus]|uniref:hypothetical protein n=1 Tax=Dialister succinatiphilus TaxID=487173 RepID=UPI003F818051
QETFRQWFPVRRGAAAFHVNRKLFANGFLSAVEPLRFNSIRNFWVQEISRRPFASLEMTGAAWGRCVPPQQETFYTKISRRP